MPYVVLARKYRSRTFEQMVGQEHVVRALTNALSQQRLHHAYLFTGTRGIGKTTVSRILAKCLNCTGADGQGGVTATPCGVCPACVEIDADRYVDYIELDAASNRGIDEIRDLLERAAYKPSVGRFKVFMIDEAHQLTKESFNALLKTLEEPPDYLKFVLATTDPQKMLPTVLSRCLQFNLRPMAPEVIVEHLQRVLDAEGIGAEALALRLLARAARGSMRDALSLTDQAIAFSGAAAAAAQIGAEAVRQMLGSVDRSHAAQLLRALAARDGAALLATAQQLREQGLSATGTLDELVLLAQQMAIEQAVPGALDAADPDHADARALAPLLAPDETQLLYSLALHGRGELELAPDEHAGLVMVLLRFLAFPPLPGNGATTLTDAAGSAGKSTSRALSSTAAAPAAGPAAATPSATASPAASALPAAPSTPASPQPVAGAPAAREATLRMATGVASRSVRPLAPAATAHNGAVHRDEVRERAPDEDRSEARTRPLAKVDAEVEAELPPWLDAPPPDDLAAYEDVAPSPHERSGPKALDRPAARDDAIRVAAPASITASPAAAPAPAEPVRTELGSRWAALVGELADKQAISALVRELALQAELVDIDDAGAPPCWRLRVERESLRAAALRDKLQAALAEAGGIAVRLELEGGVALDSPALRDAALRRQRQREAERLIADDPLLRELMAQFDTARIVPGSVRPH